jgi:hypothetical protein
MTADLTWFHQGREEMLKFIEGAEIEARAQPPLSN